MQTWTTVKFPFPLALQHGNLSGLPMARFIQKYPSLSARARMRLGLAVLEKPTKTQALPYTSLYAP